MPNRTAAEINAERIEAIIRDHFFPNIYHPDNRQALARKIVEAFPELRPHQQSMDEHGRTKPITAPLPWFIDNRKRFMVPTE